MCCIELHPHRQSTATPLVVCRMGGLPQSRSRSYTRHCLHRVNGPGFPMISPGGHHMSESHGQQRFGRRTGRTCAKARKALVPHSLDTSGRALDIELVVTSADQSKYLCRVACWFDSVQTWPARVGSYAVKIDYYVHVSIVDLRNRKSQRFCRQAACIAKNHGRLRTFVRKAEKLRHDREQHVPPHLEIRHGLWLERPAPGCPQKVVRDR